MWLTCCVQALLLLHEEARLVHGDVKPGNLLVSQACNEQPRVRVCDFGSVCPRDPLDPLKHVGSPTGGTNGYMAPEVEREEACTPASDVFSLGVTINEVMKVSVAVVGTNARTHAHRDATLDRRPA